MKICFTKHAKDRLINRTGLSIKDFEKIYDDEKIVPVGKEGSSNRYHELFYSKPMHQCFISIRDNKNSEIITILPIDYHQNIAWDISLNAQEMAKDLFNDEKIFFINEVKAEHNKTPSKFRVVAFDSFNLKRKNISTFSCEDFSYDIDLFLSNHSLKEVVKDFIKENDKNLFTEIEIMFGKKRKNTRLVPTMNFLND